MNNLRRIRRTQEISQYELGKRTKIAQSVLSLIERSYKEPSLKMKRKISRVLRCKVEEVFPEEDKS